MIRARNPAHLESLCERLLPLRGAQVLETPAADYPSRVIVARQQWSASLEVLGAAIDYGNFKAASGRAVASLDAAYMRALHDVWSRMRRYQDEVG